jgi:hypothetical protein
MVEKAIETASADLNGRRGVSDDALVRIEELGLELTVRRVGEPQAERGPAEPGVEAARMELVARFAGGLAHELNNLLTAIAGYNELILSRMSESNPLRRDAAEIERAVERAGELTHQLLAIAGRRVERAAVFDLNTLVVRLEPALQRACGEARLSLALADGLPAVRASPDQLEEVVVLLVRSACAAVRGGGTVTVETAVDRSDETTSVRLVVRDSGPMLASAALERIFEPFPIGVGGRGPGLELPAVFGLVAQNGGSMEVTSDPGGQTAFAVVLPAEPHAAGSPVARSDRETILLAEDDDVVRDVVRETLERRGYVVLDGGDAPQALALAAGHRGRIDLLLSDVSMPGMNGVELAERLREQRPGLPVLLMSGAPETDVIGHLASQPGVGFIAKPITSAALLDAVRAAIAAPADTITA